MAQHNDTGKWGEQVAYEYLVGSGYAIIARNRLIGKAEIDIVANKDNRIMFIEVKTRSTPVSDPLQAITPKKIKMMARAADSYLRSTGTMLYPQFDIISVVGSPDNYQLTHYEDAFLPPLVTVS